MTLSYVCPRCLFFLWKATSGRCRRAKGTRTRRNKAAQLVMRSVWRAMHLEVMRMYFVEPVFEPVLPARGRRHRAGDVWRYHHCASFGTHFSTNGTRFHRWSRRARISWVSRRERLHSRGLVQCELQRIRNILSIRPSGYVVLLAAP